VHGKKNVIITKFLKTCNVYTISLERFNKNGMLGWKVNVGPNVPNKHVNTFGFLIEFDRTKPKMYTSRIGKDALTVTRPESKELCQIKTIIVTRK
jgi:hypothetical protein